MKKICLLLLLVALPACARVVVPYFPTANTSKRVVGFSWDRDASDYDYFLQVETQAGGVVFGDYVHATVEPIALAVGCYQWRVEVLSDPSTHEGIGPWTKFCVLASAPPMEDLLGTSPIADSQPLGTQLRFPDASTVAANGDILIADTQHSVIKRLIQATGTVSVIAGTGIGGYNGDGAALSTRLNTPVAVVDTGTTVYIFDQGNHAIRALLGGQLSTVATVGPLDYIAGAVTRGGVIYVWVNHDPVNHPTATVYTFDGSTLTPYGPLASQSFMELQGFDTAGGTDYVIDGDGHMGTAYKIVAGVKTAIAANMLFPGGIVAVGADDAYVGAGVSIVHYASGTRTVAASGFAHISGLDSYGRGDLLATDSDAEKVEAVSPYWGNSIVLVDSSRLPFAGIEQAEPLDATHLAVLVNIPGAIYSYDTTTGATVALARNLNFPSGLAVGPDGAIYYTQDNALFRLSGGSSQIVAGASGVAGYSDNVTPLQATFRSPVGLAVDSTGAILVADTGNGAVRRVDFSLGNVSTVAMSSAPVGVASYGLGLYVTDYHDNDILYCAGGSCAVAAGVPIETNYQGDGAFADGWRLAAKFNSPNGVRLIGGQPDLVVADQFNNRVRRVNSSASTVAGDGEEGYDPNTLNLPSDAVAVSGVVYISDNGNGLLRCTALP